MTCTANSFAAVIFQSVTGEKPYFCRKNYSSKRHDKEPSEREKLSDGRNYLICVQLQFLGNRAKTRVLADAVISGMLHFFKHIVAMRMLSEFMEFLAVFGIDLCVNQERREMLTVVVLIG